MPFDKNNNIDFNAFYNKGIVINKLDSLLTKQLLMRVQRDHFIEDKDNNPLTAEWENRETANPVNNNAPNIYKTVADKIINCRHLQWHQMVYGKYSHVNIMLQLANRAGQSMKWHWDCFDSLPIVVMIYLSPDEMTESDGGQLQVGRCHVDEHGMIDNNKPIDVLESVVPENGTVVTLDNTNPTLVHKITKTNSSKSRYSLIFQFGYRENVENSTVTYNY